MRDSGYVTPATISPTAHYTGFVWARHGLSHPALVTAEGRALFHLLLEQMPNKCTCRGL